MTIKPTVHPLAEAPPGLAGDPMPDNSAAERKRAPFFAVGAKGWLTIFALLAYLIGVSLFALQQRKLLLQNFEQMQTAIEGEAVLSQAHVSIFQAIGALTLQVNDADRHVDTQRLALQQQLLLTRQAEATQRFPHLLPNAGQVNAAFASANSEPSQANVQLLITKLHESAGGLEGTLVAEREKRKALSEHYRLESNSTALKLGLLLALGLLLLGLTIGLLFRRMVTAVKRMGVTLEQSSRDLMLERQRYFHKDKMAAIGTLAAGIAHEIGNPISAISGIAQEMMDRRASDLGEAFDAERDGHPALILAQITRLAAITREISMFAAPSTAESQLLDLNAIVRSTSRLIRYDKRLEPIALQLELDPHLPAIQGTADQLTQLIINLLINAMDALQSVHGRVPSILIQTGADTERAWMLVNDNGCGMTAQTLSHVFEAFFTTKVVGQGTGLGLSLCYAIVKAHEGSIDIQSTLGVGTQVQVHFPLVATFTQEPSAV
jgi:signal transduction histidine kinase